MRKKTPLAFCRTCRDVASGLPLIDAKAYEIGHGSLARLDIVVLAYGGDQLGAFDLRLALGALEAMPFTLAPAGCRIAHHDAMRVLKEQQ
jgi:hypothetical protein